MFRNNYDNDSVTLYAAPFIITDVLKLTITAVRRKAAYFRSNMHQKLSSKVQWWLESPARHILCS